MAVADASFKTSTDSISLGLIKANGLTPFWSLLTKFNCGDLPLVEQAKIIARAMGGRGRNRDYLFATADHLASLGIADPDLTWLATQVRNL